VAKWYALIRPSDLSPRTALLLRWILAALHLLGLGVGLGAVWARGLNLLSPLTTEHLRAVFRADNLWGLAAVLWISTGLWRFLAGSEKSTGYYLQNHVFLTKMGLFLLILALEIAPMLTLIRWRRLVAAGQPVDPAGARRMATISFIQAGLVVLMVFAATAMARGIGASGLR
jgi:putative membrane protein